MTNLTPEERTMIRLVPFMASLDDDTLDDIATQSIRATWRDGDRIVTELESGADVFILLGGEAEVSLEAGDGEKDVLGKLKAGQAFGEMSSLTGDLRSATVIAKGNVEAMVIPDHVFDDLRERRPLVAVALVRTMAERLAGADHAVDTLLSSPQEASKNAARAAEKAHVRARRGSIVRAWRELVVGHKRDLAFLTLAAFVTTLLLIRVVVYLSFRFDVVPRDILRTAYMSGFALLGLSSAASLLTFRPAWRRAVALAYGIAVALILNELGVTLAFDIFYKDIHTPDPNIPFDVEELYRRTAAVRGILIALAVLIQAAYLRPFWRRAGFVLLTRARRVVARRSD